MPGVCPRCSKNVYFAEEKQALGKSWHKLCFVCGSCRKMLDSGSIAEHDGDMFCNSCYRKNFGPKGYGFGGGAGTLSMDDGKGYVPNNKVMDDQAAATYVAPKITIPEQEGNEKPAATSRNPKPIRASKWGGAEKCPRCEKSVFVAELMRGAGQAWHKSCFLCNACNKRIDSSTMCERDSQIYCRACYGKKFGPKGFGYGVGAGALQMT